MTKPGSRSVSRLAEISSSEAASWIVSESKSCLVKLLRAWCLDGFSGSGTSKSGPPHGSEWLDFGASELVVSGFGVLVAHL